VLTNKKRQIEDVRTDTYWCSITIIPKESKNFKLPELKEILKKKGLSRREALKLSL